jgi:hypothetical protein
MSARAIWLAGMRRVRRAPFMLLVLWLVTMVVTIPPALALRDSISRHLGSSVEADTAADGINLDWFQEFRAQAGPLGRSLRSDVIGFAAVMDNASAFADATQRQPIVVTTGVIFVLIGWFLTPGIICRLALDRRMGAGGFMAGCGAFVGRTFRLNLVSMLFYGTLVGSFHQWLFDNIYDSVTRDLTVERTAFFVRVACYAVFFLLLAACNLFFDVAKVRLIVEDRRSVIATMVAAAHFVITNARVTVGVYVMNVVALAAVVAAYAVVAPGVGGAGIGMWATLLIGQLYIVGRLFVKLAFWGGDIAALQTRLAYVGFVRTPPTAAVPFDEMRAPADRGVDRAGAV